MPVLAHLQTSAESIAREISDAPVHAAKMCPVRDMRLRVLDPGPADDVLVPVLSLLQQSRLVCSATPEITTQYDFANVDNARALADVDHAVVRAAFGVAETGSVLLTDCDLKINALAYLAQHLIVLLDPKQILVNLHDAYARSEFRDYSYTVFHSGPSATADIEDVLILGAQGVRSLSVLLAPIAR